MSKEIKTLMIERKNYLPREETVEISKKSSTSCIPPLYGEGSV